MNLAPWVLSITMLDLNFILENPEFIKKAAASKGVTVDVDLIVKTALEMKPLFAKVQKLREQRNVFAKEVSLARNGQREPLIEKGKLLKTELDLLDSEVEGIKAKLSSIVLNENILDNWQDKDIFELACILPFNYA